MTTMDGIVPTKNVEQLHWRVERCMNNSCGVKSVFDSIETFRTTTLEKFTIMDISWWMEERKWTNK